ncbi:CoxG family protein [Burkholderia thailandensis]|uniref:Carbon monoxide dehydrogenase subunit G family protein n=2 Tax=Burkholderia thailandensis TaxID=57975 RepID=A0AAW9CYH9_BURTH|nr:SRPBCC domain-containing protein [Burkholderia thailandensis]AHI63268.1 carbon monoxide dehydrogenase subunit G family protein [Burkholderia thailandensis H0587]AIP63182.1 carbon monoxide dehydrogenase [Burkholderia thailandensis]AOI52813.1 carbon monoxide dehydrogenase [Burkholderia thailandensis]AOJ51808.1 carbon monoxide dehydrogenase [Burkholderia thailandensis]AVR24150.1 carbon monoxide dehydrogenase [Burkholderia thailandensis]
MELNDALYIPLAPSVVWDALQDLALVRASLDHCESLSRLARGEYALALTVPLGPLRARYDVRAHVVSERREEPAHTRRTLNFRARADGIGALRGQIDVVLAPADDEPGASHGAPSTRIEYAVWATASGPLAELPGRQIKNALHELADDFFNEFCAVVQAKHGLAPNRARDGAPQRQHVFLRPAAFMGIARRAHAQHLGGALTGRAASALHHRESNPVPLWAWAAMIFFVALLLYAARWFNGG